MKRLLYTAIAILLTSSVAFAALGSLTFGWIEPTGPIGWDGYRLYKSASAGGPYTLEQDNIDKALTTVTINDQELDTPSYFVLRAFNNVGESVDSNEVVAGKPGAPSQFQITE